MDPENAGGSGSDRLIGAEVVFAHIRRIQEHIENIQNEMIEAHVAAWIEKTARVPRRCSKMTPNGEEFWIEPEGDFARALCLNLTKCTEDKAAKFREYSEWPPDEVKLVRKHDGTKVSFRFVPIEELHD